MTPNPIPAKMSPEEFLAFERAANERHEYRDGVVVAMSGAKRRHNTVSTNLSGLLWQHLRGKDCESYSNDMRVWVPKTRLYTYPDIVAVCGKPEFLDDEFDTLLNPALIIEILSASTESYDRGEKFQSYRSIPTLKEYLLVAQDHPHLEKYVKHGDGFWMLSEAAGFDSSGIMLESINCSLSLTDVYDKVDFDSD
ncbi:MAG: Uma2 family endonuclease [Acidobacteria bacterium]|nr:Uma2 family endonuclease [Acidobacteriota bacterium]